MADSEIEITPGSGAKVDTRVVDTDQHRQVVVIGDPSNVANVATVNPSGELLIAAENPVPVDISTNVSVSGDVAHDAIDVGYPIKIGGRAVDPWNLPASVQSGDRVNALFTLKGSQLVTLMSENGEAPLPTAFANDGTSNSIEAIFLNARTAVFNGTSWDRLRGNTNGLFAQIRGPNGSVATVDSGDRLWVSAGHQWVGNDTNPNTGLVALADSAGNGGPILAAGVVFNGSSAWNRIRTIGGLPAADANTGIQAVATVPHKTGYALASITARYTTTQTSTILGPTVGASQKMVVTSIQIQTSGTTAGDVVVYFGTGAYTRGTNRAVFDGHFIPSATNAPGYTAQPNVPYEGPANGSLRVTTSAAINPLTITAWYYIVAV